MEINRDNIYKIFKDFGICPTKDNGQNFLVDSFVCERISELVNLEANERVLEVGPGLGSLTQYLLNKGSVDVVEVDKNIALALEKLIPKQELTIFNNDVLKFDVSKYSKIVSNIPYNITSPLLEYLLLNGNAAKEMVLMCQTEVVDKLLARSGRLYGPINVLISLLGSIKKQFNVSPKSFIPSPKCTSTVFTISINPQVSREDIVNTYKMTCKLFLQRRKTILNNLTNIFNKDFALKILKENNISSNLRPEQISPREYLAIFFSTKNR